jgi:hypothetical protein
MEVDRDRLGLLGLHAFRQIAVREDPLFGARELFLLDLLADLLGLREQAVHVRRARRIAEQRFALVLEDRDDIVACQFLVHDVVRSRVCHRSRERFHDGRVVEARTPHGAETFGIVAVEDRHEPSDATFDDLLDHDVGIFEATLRSGGGRVLDLHRYRRTGDLDPRGDVSTGQRAHCRKLSARAGVRPLTVVTSATSTRDERDRK